ncbi:g4061 [Coccomyxa elongata]
MPADCGGQSVAMVPYGAPAQTYNQGGVLPQALYPSQQYNPYLMHHPSVVWANQYDSSANPQGSMHQPPPPVSAPVMPYYPPHTDYIGYYSQLPSMGHEGGMYYTYPGPYEGFVQPFFNAPVSHRGEVSQSATGFTAIKGRHKQGAPRAQEAVFNAGVFHERQVCEAVASGSSVPVLQIQKNGEGGARRHRRARSVEDGIVLQQEASTLETIKSNRGNQYQLKDITGHVHELCKDQFGSRFIQMKIETANPEDVAAAFSEVCSVLDMGEPNTSLMNDVFGNYVVQKFLDYGTDEQKTRMARIIQGSVKMLSLQVYGCRVIQKAIEVLSLPEKISIVEELKGHVIECINDQNGNHVIQKCIECIVPSDPIADLLEEMAGWGGSAVVLHRASVLANKPTLAPGFVNLSRHPYGCRVVQRILEKCTLDGYKHNLVVEVTENALDLSRDTYGNYVIQHSLAHGNEEEREEIISRLQDHIVELSTHKFASNVVEKCLQHGSHGQRRKLISTMLGEPSGLDPKDADQLLQTMTKDQYGNYVVQKTLEEFERTNGCPIERLFIAKLLGVSYKNPCLVDLLDVKSWVCTDVERDVLLAKIKEFLTTLKKQQYGKHIVMRIEKLLNNAATWAAQRLASQAQIASAEVGSPAPMDVEGAFQQLSIAPATAVSGGVPAAQK